MNGLFWSQYSLNLNNSVNASYIEFHPNSDRMGNVFVNRYDGNEDSALLSSIIASISGSYF
jgi:hypothetical protein